MGSIAYSLLWIRQDLYHQPQFLKKVGLLGPKGRDQEGRVPRSWGAVFGVRLVGMSPPPPPPPPLMVVNISLPLPLPKIVGAFRKFGVKGFGDFWLGGSSGDLEYPKP